MGFNDMNYHIASRGLFHGGHGQNIRDHYVDTKLKYIIMIVY